MANEALSRIEITATTSGVAEAAVEVRKLDDAQKGVVSSSQEVDKKTLSVERSLNRLQRQYDVAWRSQQKFAQAQESLGRALSQGLIDEERHAQLLGLISRQLNLMPAANNNAAKSVGAVGYQMQNLRAQIFDVAQTITTSNPLTVLAQQGPQIYQALDGPGGVTAGLKNVGAGLASMITPARVAGVAIAAAAGVGLVAWIRYGDAQREALRTLEGQGRGLGVTASAFESMAQRMAAAGKISVSTARDLANELARTGSGISTDSIERLARVSKDFAATYTKGDLQAGVEKITELVGSGADGIAAWGKSQNIYNLSQRRAIEDAVRLHDVNKAIDVTLDALNGKLAKHADTTSPLVKAWEDIKRSISDIISAFGPYIDKFATATAGLFGAAARGAQNIAGGDFSQNPVSQATKGRDLSGLTGAFGGAEPTYQSGRVDDAFKASAAEAEKAATANDKLAASLKTMAEAQKSGAGSVDENSAKLRDQQSILLDSQKALRDTLTGGGGTLSEQSAVAEKLVKIREALESTDAKAREAAIGFAGLSNAEVQSARSAEERVAAANAEETARNKLGGIIEDNTQKIVREDGAYRDRDAQVKKFEEASRNRIVLTKEQAEASDRAAQALKSETNADGTRITQAQKAAEQDDIALQSIRARTTEERAAVALRQTIAQQRGQDITGQQALAQQLAAVTQVREADRLKVVEMIRDQDMEAERIKVERDLLFSSAEARAQVIAKLEQEQALRRQGISTSTPQAQRLLDKAATNATDKLFGDTLKKGVDDAKRSVSDFATSFVTDMAHGVKAAEALANAMKKVGDSLIQGGVTSAISGLASGNFAQAGIGVAETGIGLLLNSFGPSEKSKQRKQQIMDAWAKQQQDDFDAIQKQQQAVIDAGIASAKASEQAAEEATRKAEDAARRIEGFQDRTALAGLDTSTISGQLAAFEVQAQREREEEVRAGGEALVELEEALYAERERIVRDYVDQAIVEDRRRYEEARQFLDQFARTIKQFVDNLKAGAQSPLSPADRLAQAQSQYNAQLTLAQGGNRDALNGITGYASNLLDAAKAFYASTSQFQTIFTDVTNQLTALPNQVTPEQLIVDAIGSQTRSLSDILNQLDTNGDGMISRQEASNTFLSSIFNELDTNGDGQLDKLELIRGFTQGTNDEASSIGLNTVTANDIASTNQSILNAISTHTLQLATIQQQLQDVFNTTAKTSNNAARVANNTMYSANQDTQSAVGIAGDFTYAQGGWVYGTGTGMSDSIAARLSNGEFVVRASQAREYAPQLEAMNAGRGLNDNDALVGEVRSLRAELVQLRGDVRNVSRATVAGAEHVREGVEGVRESHTALVREQKRRAA